YVFDVTPKFLSDKSRLDALKRSNSEGGYFEGRIWVDDQDYQIVKARGKSVPQFKQRFPTFETYREQIDGRYWFPTYSYADDTLTFGSGEVIHIRLRVKYSDFVKGHATVTITEVAGDDKDTNPNTKPAPTQTPTQTPVPTVPQTD